MARYATDSFRNRRIISTSPFLWSVKPCSLVGVFIQLHRVWPSFGVDSNRLSPRSAHTLYPCAVLLVSRWAPVTSVNIINWSVFVIHKHWDFCEAGKEFYMSRRILGFKVFIWLMTSHHSTVSSERSVVFYRLKFNQNYILRSNPYRAVNTPSRLHKPVS